MTYEKTVNWMYSQLPMYQKQGKTAYKANLNNVLLLSNKLNNPHKKFKSIHVAGTNGKGSSCHMLASVLQESGYKVGLFTSPHLKDFRERIRINGKEITKQFVISFIKDHQDFLEENRLSFFEMTVGMCFSYFEKQQVDIAIIEVGLGGRLDSTNIITPQISLITNIGLDHTDILGDTLSKIAFEKAGIIKNNIPVVISEYQKETYPVFEEIAKQNNAKIILAENTEVNFKTDLLGDYQLDNIKGVVTVLNHLKGFRTSKNSIKKGLLNVVKNTALKGRWHILNDSPKTILDTAHNKEGLEIVLNQIKKEKYKQLHIVLGVVKEKNLTAILPLFPKDAKYYFCCPKIDRGLDAKILQEEASKFNLSGTVFNSVIEAYNEAMNISNNEDLVYVGGSTFVVAEII
jgi:dihydrofolate synthase/folylpolyglutamate synthase